MIVTDKVEEAMDEEPLEFFIEGYAILFCLSIGFMHIDDDIAENCVIFQAFGIRNPPTPPFVKGGRGGDINLRK